MACVTEPKHGSPDNFRLTPSMNWVVRTVSYKPGLHPYDSRMMLYDACLT